MSNDKLAQQQQELDIAPRTEPCWYRYWEGMPVVLLLPVHLLDLAC